MNTNCRNCGARPHAVSCDYCDTPNEVKTVTPTRQQISAYAEALNAYSTASFAQAQLCALNAGHGMFQLKTQQPSKWSNMFGAGLSIAARSLGY